MIRNSFIKSIKGSVHSCLLLVSLLVTCPKANSEQDISGELESLKQQVQTSESNVNDRFEYFQAYFLSHPNHYQESKFLNLQAYDFLLKLELEAAYQKVLEARSKAELANNKLQVARTYRIEGAVLDTIGEYGAAFEALNKAFVLYDELQSENVLDVYNSLSNVYISLKNYPDMLKNAYKHLAAAKRFNNKISEGMAYFGIAQAQVGLKQLLDAEVNASLAEKILEQANYPFIGNVYYIIADLNFTKGNIEEALKRISQSIEADRKINFLHAEVPRLLLIAQIYQQQGDVPKAIAELKMSLTKEVFTKDNIQFLEVLERLIELTEITRDTNSQLIFLKQYNGLYKQSFNHKQAQMLAINNVRLNVFEQEKEIKLLHKEKEYFQYQLYFTLTVLVALLLVVGLLIRTRKQREQLNAYSKKLKQATQAKSDFLARMSHEIRTPINAISGLTKLMQKTASNQDDATNLRQVDEATQSLMGVINDILDFSKIEAGKLDIESIGFQLDKVISQSIQLQSIKAHKKNIELIQHIARDVPLYLVGDGLRIKQILVNLISNAVKFTDEGLVSVTAKTKHYNQVLVLEFAITDTGIGLTQKQIDGLFKSFSQVDETITRRFGGTGLGLAISKQLVELMMGEIWVESKVGEGSTFYFTVPLLEDKEQPIRSPSQQLSTLKVLVADDVNLSRQAIAETLMQANITPSLATGGQETLVKLRQAVAENIPYDLLILDWKMPDIDGLQVAAIINQEFKANQPKIIMLSAFDFSIVRQQAEDLGIKHFIEKPFSASSLIDKLQEAAFNLKVKVKPNFAEMSNAPDLANKRILVTEDNKLNQKVTLGFLKYTKADIVVAENGVEAIEAFKTQGDFDCILMDVQMPVMDGLAATIILRNDLNCTIPIIAMTANAMKRDLEKSVAAGMTAHINKPIDPEYFYQVLAEVLLKNVPVPVSGSIEQIQQDKKNQQLDTESIENLVVMDQKKAIEKLYVDQEYFNDLLADFLEKEPAFNELASLIENQSYEAVYKIIHDVLPPLTYIGAFELAKLATNLEAKLYAKTQLDNPVFLQRLRSFTLALNELVKRVKTQLSLI